MKFGKTFLSHQIPEWSVYYMNYKHLKQVIKTVDQFVNYRTFSPADLPEVISAVLSQFFFELDRDIEKVSDFYNVKFNDYHRRAERVINVLGYSNGKITHEVDTTDELDEIVSILLELRTVYRNLKWFGELNHKGFVKILKKLDKKLLYLMNLANDHLMSENAEGADVPKVDLPLHNKEAYLTTRVEALPFANGFDLQTGLDTINDILVQLGVKQLELESAERASNVAGATQDLNVLKIGNNRKHSFDKEFLEEFYELIQADNAEGLMAELQKLDSKARPVKLYLSLLNKATLNNSFLCIDLLLDQLLNPSEDSQGGLADPLDINGRNFFHQYVVSLGKKQLNKEEKVSFPGESSELNRLYGNKSGPDGVQLTPIRIEGLGHVLSTLEQYPLYQRLLRAKDNYMRTPLHYAAQYGIKDVTKLILENLKKWKMIDTTNSLDSVAEWGDQEGLTPLHLAIIGKHSKTLQNLVDAMCSPLTSPELLLLAVKLDCVDIVRTLVTSNLVDVNYSDAEGNFETALYIASKLRFKSLVQFLIERGADTELGESVFGWTPIFIACAEGFGEIVQMLVDAGANYCFVDNSGWLPMEHAALRGHLDVANMVKPQDSTILLYDIDDPSRNVPRVSNFRSQPDSGLHSPFLNPSGEEMLLLTSSIEKLPEPNRNAVNEVYRQFKQLENGSSSSVNVISTSPTSENGVARSHLRSKSPANRRKMKPIKSFGHRFLQKDEQLILLTLGTTDLRDELKPIELNRISMSKSFFTELDTALSLVVTCFEKTSRNVVDIPVIIDLPLDDHHGGASDPISFKLADGMDHNDIFVTFDIVPTYQYPVTGSPKPKVGVLGRGVALLTSAYTNVGNHLRSLHNGITVPIVEQKSLDLMGMLKFEYLCVTPFKHKQMSITRSDTYWKQLVSTRVIGHRGLGKNFNDRKSLQLGENTVESFIAAASLGASYVEFDVQLTKDYVPVVYHDFLVAESGVDIPMHALTAEQFLGLGSQNSSEGHGKIFLFEKVKGNGNVTRSFAYDDELLGKYNRPRLMLSYHSYNKEPAKIEDDLDREFKDQITSRMKLTKTWKEKGFKGNSRGHSIASDFVTLKELFKRLPKNVGFNIELKYPMLDEAESESMGEVAFDMNFYVDTILKTVYDENTTGRDILFSSFHPDICLLLSLKQPTIPILFLTEAGTATMADIRASSLQNAIRFAKKWNLLGIVSAAKTLVQTPRLAQVVKSSGLVCVTYGVENNSPELCKIQMKAGVDAVIADSVLAVREGLRKDEI